MKRFTPFIILLILSISTYSQNNLKESWSVGFGLSNHTMAGDLRSIGTGKSDGADDNSPFNLGGFLYVDKMFSPAFGLEFKGHYTTMAAAAQEVSGGYRVKDAKNIRLRDTHFDGTAYGGEMNLILNLSNLARNPYKVEARKWNIAGYLGMGVQWYDSKLYENGTNNLLVDFGKNPSEDNIASSVYYTGGLGLRYKISKNLDIEFRPTVNLNEEDHLDAARSDKEHMEVFYQTNLGLVFKFNDKEHDNYVWHVEDRAEKIDFDKLIDDKIVAKLNDYDANRDTDKDGFKDVVDPCPLRYSKTNKGCPGDKDKDGVLDDIDLCPTVAGLANNNGCPKPTETVTQGGTTTIVNNATPYAGYFEHVYFNLDSSLLTKEAMDRLNRVIIYMKIKPESRFILQGNTDAGGSNDYNKFLSERRSKRVKDYIVNTGGIDPYRIEEVGFGEEHPKFKNLPINKNNRRVDIILNE